MSRLFSRQLALRLRALPVIGSVHICANGGFPQFRERPPVHISASGGFVQLRERLPRIPLANFTVPRIVDCMEGDQQEVNEQAALRMAQALEDLPLFFSNTPARLASRIMSIVRSSLRISACRISERLSDATGLFSM